MSTIAIFDEDIFDPAIFDTRQKVFSVTINDEGGNVSDSLTRQVDYRREFIEGEPAMFDGAIFDTAIFDTEGGSGSITDSVIAGISYIEEITESAINVIDDLVRTYGAKISFSETIIVNAVLTRLAKFYRTISEVGGGMFDGSIFDSNIFDVQFGTITISDSLNVKRGAVVVLTQVTSVGATLTRMLKSYRTISDSNNISDLLQTIKDAFVSLVENVPISDDLQRRLSASRIFNEASISINDLLESIRGAKVNFVENTTVNAVLTRLSKHYRTITQNLIVSDSLAAFKIVGRRSKQAFAWINKKATKAFIFKKSTNAVANKKETSAGV